MVWFVGSAASDIRRAREAVAGAPAVPRLTALRRVRAHIRWRVAVLPNNLISGRICVATAWTAVGTPAGATGGIQERKDPVVWENRNQK
jgi:hypothetical protein